MVKVCGICDIEGCHHIREADKTPDLSPEAINRMVGHLHTRSLKLDCANAAEMIEALAARVDALTKERDEWREEWSAEADGRIAANTKLRTALARLGAVQRETLDKVLAIAPKKSVIPAPNDYEAGLTDGVTQWELRIKTLRLDPDAAAALERALEAERLKCAGIPYDPKYSDDWLGMTCAILARGQKDNDND